MKYFININLSALGRAMTGKPPSKPPVSTKKWGNMFPQFERWYIESINPTGTYNLVNKDSSNRMKGVVNISPRPGVVEVGQIANVGYYDCDRQKPYICATGASLGSFTPLPPEVAMWTHYWRGGGRTSQTIWVPETLTHFQSIVESFEFSYPNLRVYDSLMYWNLGADVFVFNMGDHIDPFYDEGTSEYLAPVRYDPADLSGVGSQGVSLILDPNDDGNFVFEHGTGISKASRTLLTTTWQTPFTESGHNILNGSLFVTPDIYGFLSVKDHRIYMVTFNPSTGALISNTLLEQTAYPSGGWGEDEPFRMVSGGTFDVPPIRDDNYDTWWLIGSTTEADVTRGTGTETLNPWGFTNSSAFAPSTAFWGERRFGRAESTMGTHEAYWGPQPTTQAETLHFHQFGFDSITNRSVVIEDAGVIVIRPGPLMYVPTLPAYNNEGDKLWEVLGWEAMEDEPPLHYVHLYSPVVAVAGKLICITLRITYKTIDEELVFATRTYGEKNNDPDSPYYDPTLPAGYYDGPTLDPESRITITTAAYAEGTHDVRRMRRCVGLSNFYEIYDITNGTLISSNPLIGQIESRFPTRGTFKGTFPPEHGVQAVLGIGQTTGTATAVFASHLGYTVGTYWEPAANYFTKLAAGDYYAYGLYSDGVASGTSSTRVTPVWPTNTQKPGVHLDILEGDLFYDPLNNQGYNRITKRPRERNLTTRNHLWVAEYDSNNNTLVEDADLPPPSCYLYDTEWHDLSCDMPHILDYWAPILNSDRTLLIFPPKYDLTIPGTSAGSKFEPTGAGSNSLYSWSGGTVANRMLHSITPTHNDWKTNIRQIWRAYDLDGNIEWTHEVLASEFGAVTSHQFSRGCCGDGKLIFQYRINGAAMRIRVINDLTGVLISDEELEVIEPSLNDGDNGGAPFETVLAGNVSALISKTDTVFDLDPFSPTFLEEIVIGKPHLYGLYPDP